MPCVLGFQPSRGDLMSMSNYSGTLFRQSLLDDFASVSDPSPATLQMFDHLLQVIDMATAAPLSARHKTIDASYGCASC